MTKHLHVTLLCLRQDAASYLLSFQHQMQRQVNKSSQGKQHEQVKDTRTGAQKLIAEIEGFDGILDDHDNEVAFISKQHYEQKAGRNKYQTSPGGANGVDGVVDHEQIAMQLRGDDDEFDRDIYDEDLSNFKVGAIMNNDEDDMRILDSLPQMVQPNKAAQTKSQSHTQKKTKESNSTAKQLDFSEEKDDANRGPLGRFIDKIVVYGFNCN